MMNGRHVHTTSVCISLRWSGGLRVVRLPAGSWHRLPRWYHGLCMRCTVSCSSALFPRLVFFFPALPWGSMIHKHTGRWVWQGSASVVSLNWEKWSVDPNRFGTQRGLLVWYVERVINVIFREFNVQWRPIKREDEVRAKHQQTSDLLLDTGHWFEEVQRVKEREIQWIGKREIRNWQWSCKQTGKAKWKTWKTCSTVLFQELKTFIRRPVTKLSSTRQMTTTC